MKEVKHNRTDFIAVYDEVYTSDQCKELISYIDKLKDNSILINEAEKTDGNIEHFTLNMAHEYDLPAWSWVGANINDNMQKCVNHYLKEFPPLGNNRFLINDFKIKKIPEGCGFHNWHFEDNNIQNANRYFVVQIYLNEEFEGGETEFLYFNQRIKPKEGRLIIFPCAFTHTHRGNPPIGGTKYIASTWGLMQSRIGNNKSEY
tara:strand:+ start:552 stop:1160 length:609 start_codon:yes stop_codon:yes gene_type:complete